MDVGGRLGCIYIYIYTPILLMAEILHQLICILTIIYRVLYITGGAGFQPSTVGSMYGIFTYI